MKYFNIILIIIFTQLFISCGYERVKSGDDLTTAQINHMQELGILDKGEEILYCSTNMNYNVSGNIITEKRIAHYWLDKENRNIESAYYDEIDTILIGKYGDSFESTSFYIVKKKNGKSFNVYFNWEKEDIDLVYQKVLEIWKKKRKEKKRSRIPVPLTVLADMQNKQAGWV